MLTPEDAQANPVIIPRPQPQPQPQQQQHQQHQQQLEDPLLMGAAE